MYEIRLVTEQREAYLPLLGLAAYPETGALYVMREQGATQCAAVVALTEGGCALAALGQAKGTPADNLDVLLEWINYKYGQQYGLLAAALPEKWEAFLAAHGFSRDADGAWTRPLTTGCCCKAD